MIHRIVLFLTVIQAVLLAQGYKPGDFQKSNANYPNRNPFYFEGRVDWNLLQIGTPANAWEFAQRGIHRQDELEDIPGAIADYQQALSMNSLTDSSCQIVSSAPTGFGQNMNPPPCMFTFRLRLANLLKSTDPDAAVKLLNEVLQIDPLRLGVNALLGEVYTNMGSSDLALQAYKAELALSPVTVLSTTLTGDEANNAHVHWALAGLYGQLGQPGDEVNELDLYLKATKWHSDTYPWRIQLARSRLERLRGQQH
jgi:tetratricopeptide (TPR) repeat protein